VALSATEYTPAEICQCKEAGFDDQFVCPITVDQIKQKILAKMKEAK